MSKSLITAALAGLLAAAQAQASPWAAVGDRQLRQDVEMLKAAGVIRGPTNSWPLPWVQIDQALSAAESGTLPPHLRQAAQRLAVLSGYAARKTQTEMRVAVTNEPALIRDFGTTAREDIDAAIQISHNFGRLHITYGAGWRDDQLGRNFHFEPSQIAYALGNWAVYGGFVEHWWGPGHDGALLFSNSARPFPKIGIKRLSPAPFNLPVLEWLGPWRLDAFVGVLNEERDDFDNPAVAGIRFAFEPTPGLEIGLNRALQLCGRSRPCGVKTWTDALIGIGDADNTGTFDEPGNQLAGFDISYTGMIGSVGVQLYVEAEAEDEDNALIEQFSRLGGVVLTGPAGSNGASWQLSAEYADTLASKLFGGRRYPGSMYNNFIYSDGFTYRDRPIGHGIDGDSNLLSLGAALNDARNRRWYASYRRVDLNRTERANNRISASREKIGIITGGVEWPSGFGDFRLEGRYQSDEPNTPDGSASDAQIEVAWRTRF